ncbi:MAG: DHH family phosphoesterase [Desulfobacterales bacterium]
MQTYFERAIELLRQSRSLMLCSHIRPDGDAIGAMLALGLGLESMQKRVLMFNVSKTPARYRFLPGSEIIRQSIEPRTKFDTAVILDCENLSCIGAASDIMAASPLVINIDHHLDNTGFGHLNLVDPTACGTAEIVYRILKRLPVTMDRAIAMAIYTGVITDTGFFRFKNTNAAAFAISSEMAACGVHPHQIARNLYGRYSLTRIKVLSRAIESLEISEDGRIAVMALTREILADTSDGSFDGAEILTYGKRIKGVQIAALILESGGGLNQLTDECRFFRVLLRTDGMASAAAISARYGGRGTADRAEFNCYGSLTEIKEELLGLSEDIYEHRENGYKERISA